jgi:hypothetical protein
VYPRFCDRPIPETYQYDYLALGYPPQAFSDQVGRWQEIYFYTNTTLDHYKALAVPDCSFNSTVVSSADGKQALVTCGDDLRIPDCFIGLISVTQPQICEENYPAVSTWRSIDLSPSVNCENLTDSYGYYSMQGSKIVLTLYFGFDETEPSIVGQYPRYCHSGYSTFGYPQRSDSNAGLIAGVVVGVAAAVALVVVVAAVWYHDRRKKALKNTVAEAEDVKMNDLI